MPRQENSFPFLLVMPQFTPAPGPGITLRQATALAICIYLIGSSSETLGRLVIGVAQQLNPGLALLYFQ
jgi:hypothetical protein